MHIGAIDPGIRSPDSLNAESGAIDPGIRSPDSLNAESGSGGVSRGLGVTLSATIGSHLRRYTTHHRSLMKLYGVEREPGNFEENCLISWQFSNSLIP